MAAASNYFHHYKLTKLVEAGTYITSDDMITLVPSATLVQLRSDTALIKVNGGDAVTFKYGDENAVVSGDTWFFVTKAEIAIGLIVNMVP